MKDECVAPLRWALPGIGMSWEGFRKVPRQVCERVDRRLAELGLASTPRNSAGIGAALNP